jgi:hypothetical protein
MAASSFGVESLFFSKRVINSDEFSEGIYKNNKFWPGDIAINTCGGFGV